MSVSAFIARRRFGAVMLLLIGALALAGCGEAPVHWNQKLTVTVETPDGIASGHTVQAVRTANKGDGLIGMVTPQEARGGITVLEQGEAVVVDLGGDRHLFLLLKGAELIGQNVLRWPEPYILTGARAISRFDGVAEVPFAKAPLLVTFDDINDPASVKRVDPDNLDASFGCPSVAAQASEASDSARTGGGADAPAKDKPCYALKSITLEITDEPVTTGRVEEVLGWWCDYRAKYFVDRYADRVSNDFARDIGGSHFKVGECE